MNENEFIRQFYQAYNPTDIAVRMTMLWMGTSATFGTDPLLKLCTRQDGNKLMTNLMEKMSVKARVNKPAKVND